MQLERLVQQKEAARRQRALQEAEAAARTQQANAEVVEWERIHECAFKRPLDVLSHVSEERTIRTALCNLEAQLRQVRVGVAVTCDWVW